jgi:hypothetical protein
MFLQSLDWAFLHFRYHRHRVLNPALVWYTLW